MPLGIDIDRIVDRGHPGSLTDQLERWRNRLIEYGRGLAGIPFLEGVHHRDVLFTEGVLALGHMLGRVPRGVMVTRSQGATFSIHEHPRVAADARQITLAADPVRAKGSFAPNGASNPVASSNEGPIGYVSRTGVGTYEVTLQREYGDLVSAAATIQANASGDSSAEFGAFSSVTVDGALLANLTTSVSANIYPPARNVKIEDSTAHVDLLYVQKKNESGYRTGNVLTRFVLRVFQAGVATDLAAHANNRVSFDIGFLPSTKDKVDVWVF